jgi:hypothetical protein
VCGILSVEFCGSGPIRTSVNEIKMSEVQKFNNIDNLWALHDRRGTFEKKISKWYVCAVSDSNLREKKILV